MFDLCKEKFVRLKLRIDKVILSVCLCNVLKWICIDRYWKSPLIFSTWQLCGIILFNSWSSFIKVNVFWYNNNLIIFKIKCRWQFKISAMIHRFGYILHWLILIHFITDQSQEKFHHTCFWLENPYLQLMP